MHDVGAPAARRRAWRILRATCRSQSTDNIGSQGSVRCRGWTVMGGSAGASTEATGAQKRVAEARREQLALHVISEATGIRT